MSHGMGLLRFRRIGLTGIVLALVLLVSPVLGAHAAWLPMLQAPIQAASGAVLGTATFTPAPSGGVMIYVHVRGFDPVAGSHRLAIANVGVCCPPAFVCAGSEVLVLPDLQFLSDGSADYTTVTSGVMMDWLTQPQGSAIVIHADTNAASAVIGCGVISPASAAVPMVYPPTPMPHFIGPGWPHGPFHPQGVYPPAPAPVPVVGHFRVVASSGLRLRAGPGTQYAILRIVPSGAILEATGVEQYASGMRWAKVCYNGLYFWAARQYLQAC
jgi:Cu/Zn superoxide dismutase